MNGDRDRTGRIGAGRIGAGRAVCPCGREVGVRHHGFWSGLVNFVLVPVLTVGLYALAVLAGLKLSPDRPAVGLVVLSLPLVSLLATTLVHVIRGHRWGCLVKRSVGWWLWWPGGALSALVLG